MTLKKMSGEEACAILDRLGKEELDISRRAKELKKAYEDGAMDGKVVIADLYKLQDRKIEIIDQKMEIIEFFMKENEEWMRTLKECELLEELLKRMEERGKMSKEKGKTK